MRNLQTVERLGRVRGIAPVLVLSLGAALTGGCTQECEGSCQEVPTQPTQAQSMPQEAPAPSMSAVPAPVVTSAGGSATRNTVTGRIKTLNGEPVTARSGPFGKEVGRYRDGAEVEIICQAFGMDAPGNPVDFGKPPLSDTTWYRLGEAKSGLPFEPERWIPQNPVFIAGDAGPVPSCPLPR